MKYVSTTGKKDDAAARRLAGVRTFMVRMRSGSNLDGSSKKKYLSVKGEVFLSTGKHGIITSKLLNTWGKASC